MKSIITPLWWDALKRVRNDRRLTESAVAGHGQISRLTVRHVEAHLPSISIQSLAATAGAVDRRVAILTLPEEELNPDFCTYAVATKTIHDGEHSWKLHFMELVDEFRRTVNPLLLLLPPPTELPHSLRALLASIACSLSDEAGIDPPTWAGKSYYLDKPWFVSGMESLKATAILESPLAYRRNNIFVQENFLNRA